MVRVTSAEDDADRLATESLADNDPTGWFERLYANAAEGAAVVPWDRGRPTPLLVEWAEAADLTGNGRRAVVVGAALGDNAEYIARRGFTTVAFDVSPTAVQLARQRFPDSIVEYRAADLLDAPVEWRDAFALVVEVATIQSLPYDIRGAAIVHVGQMVAPGGTLIVIAYGTADGPDPDGPPWPLTRKEIDTFATGDLRPARIEEIYDETSRILRWRAEFTR
jgi:threonine dehydrogenase-like Zn-dependent dehydrogenase